MGRRLPLSVGCATLDDMGKNQQRRAAKRKARVAATRPIRGPGPSAGPAAATAGAYSVADLMSSPRRNAEEEAFDLVMAGGQGSGDPVFLDNAVHELVVFGGQEGNATTAGLVATRLLMQQVAIAYEHGWQPADLVHVVRREHGQRLAKLAAAVVVAQGRIERAPIRAPQDWCRQLQALGDIGTDVGSAADPSWNVVAGAGVTAALWDDWHGVLLLLGDWLRLHAMPQLIPPPSTWGTGRPAGRAPTPTSGHDPRKLTTIRALLAKAEATEFVEEADAFTAKAQDLMTRYAIDEALLVDASEGIEVRSRRLPVDNPYAATKAQLLATVGKINRVKTIWDDHHGIATVVGLPIDLDLAELLFTSLLVQATRAMTEAGARSTAGHRLDRAPAFRRAFLLSYANRIGERLNDAGVHAQQEESESRARNLLPVLARQSAAVEVEFARLFPRISSSGAKRVDVRGWQAGRAAADRAVLTRAQVDGPV